MEWLKTLSTDYASGVTAVATCGVLTLAAITLWYLRREYSAKYRPYVIPVVHLEPLHEKLGCTLSILPKNIGSYPCKIKLKNILLKIGDEVYGTPETQNWILLATEGVGIQMPIGHVNDKGITRVREGRFKINRIEVSFNLETISMEGKYQETNPFTYEINVLSENFQVLSRPEWNK